MNLYSTFLFVHAFFFAACLLWLYLQVYFRCFRSVVVFFVEKFIIYCRDSGGMHFGELHVARTDQYET